MITQSEKSSGINLSRRSGWAVSLVKVEAFKRSTSRAEGNWFCTQVDLPVDRGPNRKKEVSSGYEIILAYMSPFYANKRRCQCPWDFRLLEPVVLASLLSVDLLLDKETLDDLGYGGALLFRSLKLLIEGLGHPLEA
jgi:hypothetical protein